MDNSSFGSFAESGIYDPLFLHQWHGMNNPLETLSSVTYASSLCDNSQQSFSQQPFFDIRRAPESRQSDSKRLKPESWNSYHKPENLLSSNESQVVIMPKKEAWSSTSTLNEPIVSQMNNSYAKPCQGTKRFNNNSTKLSQDHIIAERKRREKMSQRFIQLSALIPGLKKMDKASVLGDAIKYMKHLQDKVKTLEEQTKKRSMESVVFVKKYEPSGSVRTKQLPEVEVRFCDRDVLITIHCEKRKGIFEKAISEIENLHLSIASSCVMSFGDSALNIQVIAQKDEDQVTMDMTEIIKILSIALKI